MRWWGLQPGEIEEQEFDVPSFCPDKPEPDSNRFHKKIGGLARMRSLLPNAHYGNPHRPLGTKEHPFASGPSVSSRLDPSSVMPGVLAQIHDLHRAIAQEGLQESDAVRIVWRSTTLL